MGTLIFGSHNFEKDFLQKAASAKNELIFTDQLLDINTTDLTKNYSTISLFTTDNARADVLKVIYANGVRFIALRSAGHDHVDLDVAKELGIKVANIPAYSPHSIAEHAVTLLLALNRKLLEGQGRIKHNNFCLDGLVGFNLYGKKVGIIGTGKIGAAFATIMKGFGCILLGYDIEQNKELIAQTGITYTTLEELCGASDIISVHCPLTNSTNHLFDTNVFSKMKKGVYFINTARGAIVNTIDLIAAIENGTIAAAGLDVYENEKQSFFKDNSKAHIHDIILEKLIAMPNVIVTGHQAFLTKEALTSIAETTLGNINEFLEKGFSKNDLN
jgi:D-lactate dehydrogenase